MRAACNLDLYQDVVQNRYGFYELKNKPTPEALKDYYANKYFQNFHGCYALSYTEAEKQFLRNKIQQKHAVLNTLLDFNREQPLQLLDLGCGEGWVLQYFHDEGLAVTGLDYSDVGCMRHNPGMADHMILGEMEACLAQLKAQQQQFDIIWIEKVLEHLLNPLEILTICAQLATPKGILVVSVANDFSPLHVHLYQQGHIPQPFWVVAPDHVSYFNKDGLIALCREAGWEKQHLMGDYWIDAHLLNDRTNYVQDKSVGKSVHHTRVAMENLLHSLSVEKTNAFYQAMGELGLGRNIIGFFRQAVPE